MRIRLDGRVNNRAHSGLGRCCSGDNGGRQAFRGGQAPIGRSSCVHLSSAKVAVEIRYENRPDTQVLGAGNDLVGMRLAFADSISELFKDDRYLSFAITEAVANRHSILPNWMTLNDGYLYMEVQKLPRKWERIRELISNRLSNCRKVC